jgi:adenylate cyclase
MGMRRPAIAASTLGALALGGSAFAFDRGVWFAPSTSVAGAAISFTAVAVESFRRERARKREIQGWFGAYVSPAVVKRLVDNPDALKLGGERREVSVFFCDLAGFTTMSERLSAELLVSVTNLCLEELSTPLFNHGGYLDKYIGDAIMAVFGTPEDLPNHALAATLAALDCQRRLPALNARLLRDHGVTVGVRFGINTGEAVVGNVGSEKKKNYTVLGDTVNLASRLEGANKEFHTQILLGPLTAARIAAEVVTRPVARLRVKGKTQAVEVFEPMGEISGLDETSKRFAAASKEGFDAWSARRFAQAARAWNDALVLRPDDFLTTRYLADARRLVAALPPPDWEPILNLESK